MYWESNGNGQRECWQFYLFSVIAAQGLAINIDNLGII